MTPERNRRWVLAERPTDAITDRTVRWVEEAVPVPGEGQVLVRNLWFSADPTQLLVMRADGPEAPVPIGGAAWAVGVGRVVESRHPGFSAGDIVHGALGWEDYTVTDGKTEIPLTRVAAGVPPRLALGVFGLTGMAAYFGVRELGRVRAGETFVVTAAGGGVGSIAGQIARIQGARTVGIAGGGPKCAWLTGPARFDAAIDHRAEDVPARLGELCPDGIDCFFDNAGGPLLDDGLARLRRHARVVLCGSTSRYGPSDDPPGPKNYMAIVMERATMVGFFASDYADRFDAARADLRRWMDEGRLVSREDVVVGLKNAPEALNRMYRGENLGKQLIEVDLPPPV